MSFITTAFLLALPLVAVPVAIHLYRGRQREVIPWGAMQFLSSAVTRGRSMERFEEILLMMLRTLAVAALIFAVAQPMVRSSWLGMGADQEVILLLDNSLSMSREIGGQTAGQRMKVEAIEVVESLAGSDSVQVITAVGSEWATPEGIAGNPGGQRTLREIIESTEPTLGSADLLGSLQAAVHLAASNKLVGRRIVVFTDSQALSWSADKAAAWKQLAAVCAQSEFPISIVVRNCEPDGSDAVSNLAVTELRAARSLVRPKEAIELTVQISNTGDVASDETVVEWMITGRVVSESPLAALAKGEQTQVTSTVQLDKVGVFQVACRIKARDHVPLDQQASIVVEAANRIPVLFVQSAGARESTVSDADLFVAALGYRDGEARDWHSAFYPEVISEEALADRPLTRYRAIVLSGAVGLDPAVIDRLHEYVRVGGGLWLALGEHVDRDVFNRDWYADGDGLAPLPLETLEVLENTADAAATIHPPSREHVATMQLANTTQLDIDEAVLRQRWQFGALPASTKSVASLLESGDGKALVVENYVGQGRVLVQAWPLGLEWSNMPQLKSYVVMIQDWLAYITAPTTSHYNLSPGRSIVAGAPEAFPEASAELITSRGRTISLSASESDLGRSFRYSQTSVPGIYNVRFRAGGEIVGEVPYYVTRDAGESNFEPLGETERREVLSAAGVKFDGKATTSRGAQEVARRREPLWGALLVALVALLSGEMLLANRLARNRHGFAVNMTG